MKWLLTIMIVLLMFASAPAQGQVRADTGINVSTQPSWGPKGYDYAEYYYIPDIEVYYHIPDRKFIYQSGPHWIFSSSLPQQFKNYDLFTAYKVVINEPKAYMDIDKHRVKYPAFQGKRSKPLLFRKSNEPGTFMPQQYRKSTRPGRD